MTTYAHPHRIHLRRPRVSVSLVVIVVLAAALVGLGAWVAVDRSTGGGAAHDATQNATTLIDNELAYTSAGNVKAALALYTPDAIVFRNGVPFIGTTQIRDLIKVANGWGPFAATRIAPVTVAGAFATTYYGRPDLHKPVLAVFQLRDGRIFREWDFGLARTNPFYIPQLQPFSTPQP